MKTKRQLLQEIINTLDCTIALDMPYHEGEKILENNGYDHSNRFEVKPTDFVKEKQLKALQAAKELMSKI